MKSEHKEVILASLKEKNDLLQTQGELLQKQGELIQQQKDMIEKIMESLMYCTETSRLQSHKIAELMVDHQLVSLIKPVNSWIN